MENMRKWVLLLTLALASFSATAADAPMRYRLTDLGESADSQANLPTSLNDKGEIIGAHVAESGSQRVFLWRNGKAILLDWASDQFLPVGGINNNSDIVGCGSGKLVTCTKRVYLHQGKVTELGQAHPAADSTVPVDINNNAVIVGYSSTIEGAVPFIYRDGAMQVLGDWFGTPSAINDRDQIVGTMDTKGDQRAFLWQKGTVQRLGALPSADGNALNNHAVDINNRGEVVGVSDTEDLRFSLALIWREDKVHVLPPLPGHDTSEASAINERGHVVGYSDKWSGALPEAVIWQEGTPTRLSDLLDPNDPNTRFVTLLSAEDINERGQIIAQGWDERSPTHRGYLLTPIED